MLFQEIVGKIGMLRDVPVFYWEDLICATVTYLKPTTKKERGVYLPDCEIGVFYENAKNNNPIEFSHMKSIIESICEFNEYTYALFNVLHELGHWVHYTQFRAHGYSDYEYIDKFEIDRIKLYAQREEEAKAFRGNTVEEFNNKYSKLYCELPTEKEADNYAATHLVDFL